MSGGMDPKTQQHLIMLDDRFLSTRQSPDCHLVTPTVIANARREWAQTRDNPLHSVPVYGQNPYHTIWKEHKRPDPRVHALPGPSKPVPELQELQVQCSELTWLEDLGGDFKGYHNSSVYKVLYRGRAHVLKVYRCHNQPDFSAYQTVTESLDGRSRFENERQAYGNLVHFGVCEDGFVPRCYGWFKLQVDAEAKWLHPFALDPEHPNAILLEFLPSASQLNVSNITFRAAQSAMLALSRVHAAGVLHRDINPRNHLVLPEGRVLIIDFDVALTWPDKRVNRLELKWESESAWSLYFQVMLTDKLIELDPTQTPY